MPNRSQAALCGIVLAALALAACTGGGGTTTTLTTPTTVPTTAPTTTTTTTPTPPVVGSLGPPAGPVINHSVNPACGTELWDLKTLQDPGSASVDPVAIDVSSVDQLNQAPDAGVGGDTRVGVELHVYRFAGQLVEAKLEADSDYHVVLKDAAGKTLIAEFPAAKCAADANATARGLIDSARQSFERACGPIGGSFKHLQGTVAVTGVGFYDTAHGQSGADPLGDGWDVELHPVIGFSGSCATGG